MHGLYRGIFCIWVWGLALTGGAFALDCPLEISLQVSRPVEGRSNNFSRDAAAYLLDAYAFVSFEADGERTRFVLEASSFPEPVATALADVASVPDAWAPLFSRLTDLARDGWYNHTRESRLAYALPEDQGKFFDDIGLGETEWKKLRFQSIVKPEIRSVFRSPAGAATRGFPAGLPKISLSTSAANPFKEETEVIIQRPGGKKWDFYSYRNGRLATTTEVQTSRHTTLEAPAPYSCLACHYNPFSRTFGRAPVNFVHGYSERLF